ncbi:hypothetical protein [Plantactinospora endophytica]|uniref:Uncharacterized protein n=1 Tax=Plantactinospora endophytica TaxID=673535 RepID=A0ABQ4EBI5_9ACTN|nr:hypothetical protein [Plantactinospora endophytica]GIG92097.1 hypothetical protein Pen02_70330 [Plantactinospora endophytica]
MPNDDFEDFTPDDLRYLNLALRAFPGVADGLRAVVDVAARLRFPVEGADALRAAIDSGGVRLGSQEIPVAQLPQLMPEFYFPIESEEDFVAKVADACARQREPYGPNMPAVTLMEATAERRGDPPRISEAEILRLAGFRPDEDGPASPGAGSPGVGGLTKRGRERR